MMEVDMPDFTVIEGGGNPGDRERRTSQAYLEDFIVDLLRGVGGSERSYRCAQHLIQFVSHGTEHSIPLVPVLADAIASLRAQAHDEDEDWGPSHDRWRIVEAALRYAAESMAVDPAAKGRRSQRLSDLDSAASNFVVSQERRSRASGWSYIEHITRGLEPIHKVSTVSRRQNAKPSRGRKGRSRDDIVL
jgi:hypothetical protein